MKYYSEVTKNLYDTMDQLEEAEASITGCKVKKRAAKMENNGVKSEPKIPTKKQLASDVEAAEAKVREAQANMELAKQKAQDLSKKYLEEIDAIMEPAKQMLKDAQKARYDAIQKFNDAYGAYTTTYTGARAADEFARAVADITSFFPRFFKF